MTDFFSSPAGMALLAGCATWGFTTLGAAMVYTAKSFSRRSLDVMLGFAAGVMIAASYWSLLAPALEMTAHLGRLACVPVALGFLAGAGVLRLMDIILPHIHPTENVPDGPPSKLPRSALLVFAITLHNIPEGLAVGVAFGAAASGSPEASIAGALTLMFGIGLQNVPEGVAVSVPLLREGFSKRRAFFYGQLSGIVEPIAAVLGALAVGIAQPVLPVALAFAAGAMIFVVVEEVIPESHASGHGDAASLGVIIGSSVLLCFDVALGKNKGGRGGAPSGTKAPLPSPEPPPFPLPRRSYGSMTDGAAAQVRFGCVCLPVARRGKAGIGFAYGRRQGARLLLRTTFRSLDSLFFIAERSGDERLSTMFHPEYSIP